MAAQREDEQKYANHIEEKWNLSYCQAAAAQQNKQQPPSKNAVMAFMRENIKTLSSNIPSDFLKMYMIKYESEDWYQANYCSRCNNYWKSQFNI